MSNTANKAELNRIFSLVCPTRRGAHWKDRIDQLVTFEEMAAADAYPSMLAEAVEFFTATYPNIARTTRGFHVTAKGYRAGPAGDY